VYQLSPAIAEQYCTVLSADWSGTMEQTPLVSETFHMIKYAAATAITISVFAPAIARQTSAMTVSDWSLVWL
jgi:hypothetical protein